MSDQTGVPPPPADVGAEPSRERMRQWQLLALASAAFLLVGLVGHVVGLLAKTSLPLAVVLAILAGVAFVAVSVVIVAVIVRLRLPWKQQLALAIICAGIAAGLGWAHIELLKGLFVIGATTFIGALVSWIVRDRNIIVPIVIVAAVVDTYGVYLGFVAEMAKKAPEFVKNVSAVVPGATAVATPVPLLSAVGPGDFLFMGLFVAAVYRLRMNMKATLWALFIAFLVAPVIFSLVGVEALPGLPLLGVAVLVANWRQFRFSRAEKFALIYMGLLLIALLGAAFAIQRALK